MKAEITGEAMADAMDMGDTAEEADDVYNQILGEIGMDMEGASVGMGKIGNPDAAKQPAVANNAEEMDDLEARLAALQ